MLIPGSDKSFYYHDIRVVDYIVFVDSCLDIVEIITTEDGERFVIRNEWDNLNDIEKFVALERGWDIPSEKEQQRAKGLPEGHETEIVPFPLRA